MQSISKELKVAIEGAKLGAEHAFKYFNSPLSVSYKNDNTPVTLADKESEVIIKRCILKSFPDANFVGEEGGGSTKRDKFWVIDPIDGTKLFIRGIPNWAVLIALVEKNEIILGLCYFPNTKDVLYAQKGMGTFLNGKRVHVSSVADIKKAFFTFGNLKHFKNKKNPLFLIETCGSSRSFDTAYNYSLLASGRVDIAIDSFGVLWDIAPFKIMIEEAGGRVTSLLGKPWSFTDKGCIATNGLLQDDVVRILNT